MRWPVGSIRHAVTLAAALLPAVWPGRVAAEAPTGAPAARSAAPAGASARPVDPATVAALGTEPTRASPAVHARRTYTLKECLSFAEQNYPRIQEASAQAARMRAQLWETKMLPFGVYTVTGGGALAPTLAGSALYSPNNDVTLTSSLALAWRFGIDAAIPLWTFGKLAAGMDAAGAQVKVGEHAVRKARNDVRLSVHQAFYGVQLSRDALALVGEAIARIDKYLPRVEEKVRSGDGDDIQLLKLRINRAELDARRSEAQKQERIALSGLRFLTGKGEDLDVPDEPLQRVTHALGPVGQYLTAARLFRPEVNMAHAGVLVRRAQLELERARRFPDLAFGVTFSRSYAPEVADQVNPFVRDDANFLRYGAALVLKWDLDFLPRMAKIAQAEAQLEEIRATERYALGGVGVEVETAFAEAVDARRRLEAYSDAVRYARQWLVKVQQGIDIGTFDDEDITDPAREYALKRFLQMTATMDYNVAMAKLAQASGWDAVTPVR